MATASAVSVRAGNDQFRGLFSDTWAVTATLNAGSLVDGAGETDDVTVPGVALGDMVLGASLGVEEKMPPPPAKLYSDPCISTPVWCSPNPIVYK